MSTLLRSARKGLHRCTHRRLEIARATAARHDHEGPFRWTATCDARLFRCGSALVVSRNGLPGSVPNRSPNRVHRTAPPARHRRLDQGPAGLFPRESVAGAADRSAASLNVRPRRHAGAQDWSDWSVRLHGQIDIRQNTCRLRPNVAPSPCSRPSPSSGNIRAV